MTQNSFKTIRTLEGITLKLYREEGKNPILHSLDGPAIKYPKGMKRPDEYYIYGIPYTKKRWEETKESSKVAYMYIDPKLEG